MSCDTPASRCCSSAVIAAVDWSLRTGRLLACVDAFSDPEAVVPVASEWAKAFGLDVQVAMVSNLLDAESETAANTTVHAISDRFVDDGVAAEAIMMRGSSHIAATLADFAGDLPADLVAINASGRDGVSRVVLGSVAMGVVGLAPCPVLVVPAPAHRVPKES